MPAFAPGSWLRRRRGPLLQVAVHVGALLPLALLIWDGLHGDLTANPIQAITARTGKTALVLLMLSLACTPANTFFGLRRALRWRRPLGMYAFLYVSLHFLTFSVLDYGLDPGLLRQAIFEKRFALVGLAAGLLLAPLAITATRGWMRRLGKNWKRLHRLVYLAAVLAVVHYVWLVKSDTRVPYLYGAILAALLIARTRPVKRGIASLRQRTRRQMVGSVGGRPIHRAPIENHVDESPDYKPL
jgi:methionine sulfoxide reductase heme-binding subunit